MSSLLLAASLMGLFGGAHCAVMCGPVASALCAKGGRFTVPYNLGRIVAYGLLGIVVGSVGALPSGWGFDFARFALRAFAALCLLTVGLHLAGLPSFVRGLEGIGAPLWRRLAPIARRLVPLRSPAHAVGAGLLWAFMPCGLLYGAVALAASSGSATHGATTMLAFGVGTVPVMAAFGAMARRVAGEATRMRARRIAGALFVVLGLWSTAGLARQVGFASVPSHACCPARR